MKTHMASLRKQLGPILWLSLIATSLLVLPSHVNGQSRLTRFSQLLANRASRIQVAFTYSPGNPSSGLNVQFVDTSANGPTSWLWSFGDGTTSTAQNPIHAFSKAGFYKVSLTAANNAGSKVKIRTITVMPASSTSSSTTSAASFNYTPSSIVAGQSVQFTDTSTNSPTSWQWHFGDGMTSTTKNPTHPYGASGTYTVTLDASNNSGTKTASQMLTVTPSSPPSASFTSTPTSPAVGQSVQFTDTSTGAPTAWQWNFGDGSTSTARSPSHIYTSAASYTVTLMAANSSGSQSVSRTITVVPTLTASFAFTPISPATGQVVHFTDTSTGSPTSWRWNFGDGSISTAQNPSYTFTTAASYTVTLTVSNTTGSKSISQTITVIPALTASFTYNPASPVPSQAVQFTDTSTGSPTSWQWDFGDGASSTVQNPSHAYATIGSYFVTLTVRTGSNLNSASKTVAVGQLLSASFAYGPASPPVGQAVQFTDTSTGNPTTWDWDFGDGAISASQNPNHVYNVRGSYLVTLTIGTSTGSNSTSRTVNVGVGAAYWVSPTGTAAWAVAKSEDPLSGASCCSLATANANAVAGDMVYLRGGTYATSIKPSNSGTLASRITFCAYPGESVIFTVANPFAIIIDGKNYVVIDGISTLNSNSFFHIGYGASYNEIKNCTFSTSSGEYSLGVIENLTTAGAVGPASMHNWIHGNVFTKYGKIIYSGTGDDWGTVRIGNDVTDPSSNNTIEDNVFSYGGHDCFDVGGRYNVIRNNVFHNEEAYFVSNGTCSNKPPSGYFGNRCLILTNYGDGVGTAQHTLVEGNRLGYAGTPPDDDGCNGIEDAGYHTVIRYNFSYGNYGAGLENKKQGGYSSSVRSGSKERVYNNTFYHNGYGTTYLWGVNRGGIFIGAKWDSTQYDWPQDVAIKNNIIYDSYNGQDVIFETPYVKSAGPVVYTNNFTTLPGFVNPDMTDKTSLALPDLSLQTGSAAMDAGTYLTTTNGSGSSQMTLIVHDSLYFQDGTWGSALSTKYADWIAVGTVNNIVQISSINYATHTLTLASPITWSDNSPVWLYKNSKGTRVLYGAGPEQGAYPVVR